LADERTQPVRRQPDPVPPSQKAAGDKEAAVLIQRMVPVTDVERRVGEYSTVGRKRVACPCLVGECLGETRESQGALGRGMVVPRERRLGAGRRVVTYPGEDEEQGEGALATVVRRPPVIDEVPNEPQRVVLELPVA